MEEKEKEVREEKKAQAQTQSQVIDFTALRNLISQAVAEQLRSMKLQELITSQVRLTVEEYMKNLRGQIEEALELVKRSTSPGGDEKLSLLPLLLKFVGGGEDSSLERAAKYVGLAQNFASMYMKPILSARSEALKEVLLLLKIGKELGIKEENRLKEFVTKAIETEIEE